MMPPVTPYDVEAIKVLYKNARKELAKYNHSKDIKTQIEFEPEQQNVADRGKCGGRMMEGQWKCTVG